MPPCSYTSKGAILATERICPQYPGQGHTTDKSLKYDIWLTEPLGSITSVTSYALSVYWSHSKMASEGGLLSWGEHSPRPPLAGALYIHEGTS